METEINCAYSLWIYSSLMQQVIRQVTQSYFQRFCPEKMEKKCNLVACSVLKQGVTHTCSHCTIIQVSWTHGVDSSHMVCVEAPGVKFSIVKNALVTLPLFTHQALRFIDLELLFFPAAVTGGDYMNPAASPQPLGASPSSHFR